MGFFVVTPVFDGVAGADVSLVVVLDFEICVPAKEKPPDGTEKAGALTPDIGAVDDVLKNDEVA